MKISADNKRNRDNLRGAKVAVLGAARSGIALAGLLKQAGASVLLSDSKPVSELSAVIHEVEHKEIEMESGGHSERILEMDLIGLSPGIPADIPILKQASRAGIPIAGEIEIASWFCESPIIAVTGSNGKTTTTTLSGDILKAINGGTVVAGNIGNPFAGAVQNTTPDGLALLEISSFQLETIFNFHPQIVVIMNLTENHLDRYPDFEAYARAKLNILKNMTPGDLLIYNRDDAYLHNQLHNRPPKKLVFSLEPHDENGAYWENDVVHFQMDGRKSKIRLKDYRLPGPHNRYNMMVAVMLGLLHGASEDVLVQKIAVFPGIPHRLEKVRTINGITFVNDSKATTVESLIFALKSFKQPLLLIAGGKDKGGDFARARTLLSEKAKAAVLIGQAAGRIKNAWDGIVPLLNAANLEEAVHLAYQQAKAGDVVLLSPACSSFDMFRDYEQRGDNFKALVEGIAA
jgi:UDP-N-acetylmuramoylalanine--D-glutamate ligase